MVLRTAKDWEIAIEASLRALPPEGKAITVGLFQLMRYDFEDKFDAARQAEQIAKILLPPARPAELAERAAASVDAILSRLCAAICGPTTLVKIMDEGIELPAVRRTIEIRARDRTYKRNVGIPTKRCRNSDTSMSESVSETPPQVSLSPITPISSFPSPEIIIAGEPQNGEPIDRKIRIWLSGQTLLPPVHPKMVADAAQMVRIGGWDEMVSDVEKAIEYTSGGNGAVPYALKTMMNRHADAKRDKRAAEPKSHLKLPTKGKVYNV